MKDNKIGKYYLYESVDGKPFKPFDSGGYYPMLKLMSGVVHGLILAGYKRASQYDKASATMNKNVDGQITQVRLRVLTYDQFVDL